MNQKLSDFRSDLPQRTEVINFEEHIFNSKSSSLSRKALERLDLLLLLIESIDLNGSQSMLWTSSQVGLSTHFPTLVELWKSRCHNPLRKSPRPGSPKIELSNALISLICAHSNRIYPLLRQMLSSREPDSITKERWQILEERYCDLLQERMNTKRGAIQKFLHAHNRQAIIRQLLITLSLCSGVGGPGRLQASLFDRI